jgi:hypothetical protein
MAHELCLPRIALLFTWKQQESCHDKKSLGPVGGCVGRRRGRPPRDWKNSAFCTITRPSAPVAIDGGILTCRPRRGGRRAMVLAHPFHGHRWGMQCSDM